MSFSQNIKRELCQFESERMCCIKAEAYGAMLFSNKFSIQEMSIKTENLHIAQKIASDIAISTGVFLEIRTKAFARGTQNNRISKYSTLSVDSREERTTIWDSFSHNSNETSLKISYSNFEEDECINAFLRGAFLSCGTFYDPQKSYRLEFIVPHLNLGKHFCDFLQNLEHIKLTPKFTTRNSNYIVYIKSCDEIIEFLNYIGSKNCANELSQIKALKEVRNDVNRRINFDTANIDKTVNAAQTQIRAIKKLMKSEKYSHLSDELKELAEIRVANPEMSLRELGEIMTTQISRSGLNHRLQKLVEMAKD